MSKIELGKTVEIENWGLHQTVESKKSKLGKNVENRFWPFQRVVAEKVKKIELFYALNWYYTEPKQT